MTSEPAPESTSPAAPASEDSAAPRRALIGAAVLGVVAAATLGVAGLLVTIFEHRQEARTPFVRLVEVDEVTTDPEPWGVNWPRQFDSYRRTVDVTQTRYGGSSAMPEQKLKESPWLRRLYAGYAFSLDYRERRVCLNHDSMQRDSEGRFRVVVAAEDPGVPNWLHTEGRSHGVVYWRFMLPEGEIEPMTCRVVDVGELRDERSA